MPSTQLSCPHCGSVLTFGAELPAGTSVPCLICNRTFGADGTADTVERPSPTLADERPVSPLTAKPARIAAPVAVGVGLPPVGLPARPARPIAAPAAAAPPQESA